MKWTLVGQPEEQRAVINSLGETMMEVVGEEIGNRAETQNKENSKMQEVSNKPTVEIVDVILEIRKISREIHVALIRSQGSKRQPRVYHKVTPLKLLKAKFKKELGPPYNKNTDLVFLHASSRPPGPGDDPRLPPDVTITIACENGNIVVFLPRDILLRETVSVAKRVRKFLCCIPFSCKGVNKKYLLVEN